MPQAHQVTRQKPRRAREDATIPPCLEMSHARSIGGCGRMLPACPALCRPSRCGVGLVAVYDVLSEAATYRFVFYLDA